MNLRRPNTPKPKTPNATRPVIRTTERPVQINPVLRNKIKLPETLTKAQFFSRGPHGIMTPNNFWLHFCHLPEAIPNYRNKRFVKYLEENYPELLKELTEKITQIVQKTKTIETSKIYEMFGDKLYEAYCIGIRAGFTNEELFH